MLVQGSEGLVLLVCHFAWNMGQLLSALLKETAAPYLSPSKTKIYCTSGDLGLKKHDRKVVMHRGEARICHQGSETVMGWGN